MALTVVGSAEILIRPTADAAAFQRDLDRQLTQPVERASRQAGDKGGRALADGINNALLALGGAAIARRVTGFLNDSVNLAGDLGEAMNKVAVVFGDANSQVVSFADEAPDALGQTRKQALEAAATFGNLFRSIGLVEDASADMSTEMVQLAADLASFNNVPVDEALAALQSGLVGEVEPLRRFGVLLDEATLKQRALADGLTATTMGVLPPAIRAQAAYREILSQTGLAQGDFARTSDSLANQQRRVQASMEELQTQIGSALLPAMEASLPLARGFAEVFAALPAPVLATGVALVGLGAGALAIGRVLELTKPLRDAFSKIELGTLSLRGSLASLRTTLTRFASIAINPITLAAGGAIAAFALWNREHEEAERLARGFTDALKQERDGIEGVSDALILEELSRRGVLRHAREMGVSIDLVTRAIHGEEDALRALGPTLRDAGAGFQFIGTEQSRAAKHGLDILNTYQVTGAAAASIRDAVNDLGASYADATTRTDDFAVAQKQVGLAKTADGANDLSSSLEEITEGLDEATDATDAFGEALSTTLGIVLDGEEALDQFRAAQDDLRESLRENGRSFDANTEKGRANREAIRDLISAAEDLIAARVHEGRVGQDAASQQAALIRLLENQRKKYPELREQLDRYIAKIRETPTNVVTEFDADTSEAKTAVTDLQRFIANRLRSVEVRIGATGTASGGVVVPATASAMGGTIARAAHGLSVGPRRAGDLLLVGEHGPELSVAHEGAIKSNSATVDLIERALDRVLARQRPIIVQEVAQDAEATARAVADRLGLAGIR